MRTGFKIGGIAFMVVGLSAIVGGVVFGGAALLGLVLMGVTFVVVGLIFFAVSGFLKGLDPNEILQSGLKPGEVAPAPLKGIARVVSTRDTGVILNNVNLIVEVGLMVETEDRSPYEATTRHVMQGRNQWGALQPGMTVPVLVNPNDPSKVIIDPDRPIITGVGQPTGSTQVVVKSAADIVSTGLKASAVLESVVPTGMTAGQAKAGLPAEQADDPIMHVVFSFSDSAGTGHRSEIMIRVPDGKGHALQKGATLPISYLADNPASATIDWDSVPSLQV